MKVSHDRLFGNYKAHGVIGPRGFLHSAEKSSLQTIKDWKTSLSKCGRKLAPFDLDVG